MMIKSMIAIQLERILSSVTQGQKKKGRNIFAAFLFIYIFAAFGFSLGATLSQMIGPFADLDLGWMYFAMAGTVCIAAGVMVTLMMVQSSLYDSRDNDLLLSMPIKPGQILFTRLTGIYLLIMLTNVMVLATAMIVYAITFGFDLAMLLLLCLGGLLLGVLTLAIVSVLGFIIAAASSVTGHKTVVTIVTSILLMAGFLYGYTSLTSRVSDLVQNGVEIAAAFQRTLPPVYFFGVSLWSKDIGSFLITALICLAPSAIVYIILAKSYVSIITRKKGERHRAYTGRKERVNAPVMAIAFKEMRTVAGIPIYMLNTMFGAAGSVVLAVLYVIKGGALSEILGMAIDEKMSVYVFCALLSVCALLTSTSAASLSLEGKRIEQLKSMPLEPAAIFCGKILANIILGGVPITLSAIAITVYARPSLFLGALMILLPLAAQCFAAVSGLIINLFFPKMDWTTHSEVVKRSMATMISAFMGMGIAAGGMLLYTQLSDLVSLEVFLWCAFGVLTLLCILMSAFLKGKKCKTLFDEL